MTFPIFADVVQPDFRPEAGKKFQLVSDYKPAGDQPQAIEALTKGLESGEREQVLLGVTGSGKTFTVAEVIQTLQRPALILAPNKTLAAQLYGEMKSFFPHNAVEYFVSYYDYYQPEAYVARTDTFIEKEAMINEQIDRMRHAATRSLLERDDVIIVASVSCIYGIGSVETYQSISSPRWSSCNTNATISVSDAAIFACGATPSKSFRRIWKIAPGASLCSATILRRLSRSTPSPARKALCWNPSKFTPTAITSRRSRRWRKRSSKSKLI
jgi:hypothetical protein